MPQLERSDGTVFMWNTQKAYYMKNDVRVWPPISHGYMEQATYGDLHGESDKTVRGIPSFHKKKWLSSSNLIWQVLSKDCTLEEKIYSHARCLLVK